MRMLDCSLSVLACACLSVLACVCLSVLACIRTSVLACIRTSVFARVCTSVLARVCASVFARVCTSVLACCSRRHLCVPWLLSSLRSAYHMSVAFLSPSSPLLTCYNARNRILAGFSTSVHVCCTYCRPGRTRLLLDRAPCGIVQCI